MNIKRFFVVLASLLLVHLSARADNEYHKQQKLSFEAAAFDALFLSSKFANIDFIVAETANIEVDLSITVEADSPAKAEAFFRKVLLQQQTDARKLLIELSLAEKVNNQDFKIHCKITLPQRIAIDLEARFGAVFAQSLMGEHHLRVSYGNLRIDKLINPKDAPRATVDLAYSNGQIEQCEWLVLNVKYSKMSIRNAKAVVLTSKHSKIEIEQISSLVAVSKYDSPFSIGHINNLKLSAAYSTCRIESIEKKLIADTEYSDLKIGAVGSDFEQAELNVSYGNAQLPIPVSQGYQIEGHAEYGSLRLPNAPGLKQSQTNQSADYTGQVGTGSPKLRIKATARYSTIDLEP